MASGTHFPTGPEVCANHGCRARSRRWPGSTHFLKAAWPAMPATATGPIAGKHQGCRRTCASARSVRGRSGTPPALPRPPELAQLPTGLIHQPWRAAPLELKGAGVELGTTYPGHRSQGGPRTRAESLCEGARDVSTPRHPLYTPANPAIVASLTTLGDDMDDEKPDLEPMPDAMSSVTEAPKEAKPAVKKRRKTAAKKVAKKGSAEEESQEGEEGCQEVRGEKVGQENRQESRQENREESCQEKEGQEVEALDSDSTSPNQTRRFSKRMLTGMMP